MHELETSRHRRCDRYPRRFRRPGADADIAAAADTEDAARRLHYRAARQDWRVLGHGWIGNTFNRSKQQDHQAGTGRRHATAWIRQRLGHWQRRRLWRHVALTSLSKAELKGRPQRPNFAAGVRAGRFLSLEAGCRAPPIARLTRACRPIDARLQTPRLRTLCLARLSRRLNRALSLHRCPFRQSKFAKSRHVFPHSDVVGFVFRESFRAFFRGLPPTLARCFGFL